MALAPAEQLELVLALEQVAGLVAAGDGVGDHLHDLAREQPLDDRLDGLLGDERHQLARVELAEVVARSRSAGRARTSIISTVLSPSNVVKMSVSAFSAANRLTAR